MILGPVSDLHLGRPHHRDTQGTWVRTYCGQVVNEGYTTWHAVKATCPTCLEEDRNSSARTEAAKVPKTHLVKSGGGNRYTHCGRYILHLYAKQRVSTIEETTCKHCIRAYHSLTPEEGEEMAHAITYAQQLREVAERLNEKHRARLITEAEERRISFPFVCAKCHELDEGCQCQPPEKWPVSVRVVMKLGQGIHFVTERWRDYWKPLSIVVLFYALCVFLWRDLREASQRQEVREVRPPHLHQVPPAPLREAER